LPGTRGQGCGGDVAVGGDAEADGLGAAGGGGVPYFARREHWVDLELVETRTFSSRVVYLHYRVAY
jgi:hypothetical protein